MESKQNLKRLVFIRYSAPYDMTSKPLHRNWADALPGDVVPNHAPFDYSFNGKNGHWCYVCNVDISIVLSAGRAKCARNVFFVFDADEAVEEQRCEFRTGPATILYRSPIGDLDAAIAWLIANDYPIHRRTKFRFCGSETVDDATLKRLAQEYLSKIEEKTNNKP